MEVTPEMPAQTAGTVITAVETIPVTETTARIPVTEITAAVIPTSVRTNLRSRLRLSRTSRWGYTE